jgi:allantoin racemase
MTRHSVLVLNPNSTVWMTDRVAAALQFHLGASFELQACTLDKAPPVIDGPTSFDQASRLVVPACEQALRRNSEVNSVLLACFGDPGLEALRAACQPRQVFGLADCAMADASARHGRYGILTCGPEWVGLLQRRATDLGHAEALVGVWALPVNGRELALDPQRWQGALQDAADQARRQGAQALILGGAAFAGLNLDLASPLPQIDPMEAAANALLKLSTALPAKNGQET